MVRRSVFSRTIRAAGMTAALGLIVAACEQPIQESAADMTKGAMDPVTRGQYLVSISGCNDCHTPGYFFGMPDFSRRLGGSDVGFFMPGMGYFYGPNLSPDQATGIGAWSEDQIVTAIRTGVRPDGRVLSPIMPWMGLSNLTDEDAYAIAAYLKSLPVVGNQAPPPTGADQPPPAPYLAIVVPEPPPEP